MSHPLLTLAFSKLQRLRFVAEPTGSVKMCAHETVPTGWLECDGRALDSSNYPELYAIIGTRYGDGTDGIGGGGTNDFNLPDLRGQFIRGWNHAAIPDANNNGRDPDSITRGDGSAQGGVGVTGQATGDQVGSVQSHSFRKHAHTYPGAGPGLNASGTLPGRATNSPSSFTTFSQTPAGVSETRPVNITMMYIIRV